MSDEDMLQQNIQRATAQRALKKIRVIVDEEHEKDVASARVLCWCLHYGWIALMIVIALLARLMGVY